LIYDLIIVGSGPVALSCIIEAPRNLNIAVISQNYDTGYRLDSFGDKAYSESFGGGLDSWHGVLSSNLFLKFFPNNIDHYKNFYNKFYLDNKLNNEDFSMNKIFIPRKKISSKALLKQLNQKNNISLIFDKILYINDSKIISLVSDEHKYFAKKVFLAAGAVGTGKILHESGLAKLNSYIGNLIFP